MAKISLFWGANLNAYKLCQWVEQPPKKGWGPRASYVAVPFPVGGNGQCGELTVPENRDDPADTGREIEIAYVVLPATGGVTLPDPLFFLAGGPGQAAIELAPIIAVALSDVHQSRDFCLYRSTGNRAIKPAQL